MQEWNRTSGSFCRLRTPAAGGRGCGRLIAAPTADNGPFLENGGRGHTPGWLLSAFGRFTFSPSPTVFKKIFRDWVGEALGPPAVNRPSTVGSTNPGAVVKSQPLQFSTRPGPSGPKEIAECHSNFARRKFCKIQQVRVPRYRGSRGRASWRREACRTADCARPLASFGSFSTRKRNSPPGRRNSLRIPGKERTEAAGQSPALQSSSNDACFSDCPLIRPSVRTGAPSPQGEGLKRSSGEISPISRDPAGGPVCRPSRGKERVLAI